VAIYQRVTTERFNGNFSAFARTALDALAEQLGYPASMPLRPRELAATIYEALEIGPDTVVYDRLARPLNCAPANQSRSCTANGA
jgi:hypothetical protein